MDKLNIKTGVDASETSLMGYISITHGELEKRLGEGEGSSDKTLDEWSIEGEVEGEKVIATIYDLKNYGMDRHDITEWHIGGKDRKAVDLIRAIFVGKSIRNY